MVNKYCLQFLNKNTSIITGYSITSERLFGYCLRGQTQQNIQLILSQIPSIKQFYEREKEI